MSRSRDLANLADEATGGLVKADIGLGNVDNTADSAKPVSTAQQTEIDKLAYQGKPHIIPEVLYPAVGGNDINGTDIDTSHGSTYTYGELHTDGRKYYYTDIKGSKPIKDPRIGGHFGSQRHAFRSVQLLEQETATHGKNVYSIDGREWIRAVGNGVELYNTSVGQYVFGDDDAFYEVTGYFTDVNLRHATRNQTTKGFVASVDGNVVGASERTDYETSANTPLGGRYLDRSSLVNLSLGQTLGIHTLKISLPSTSDAFQAYGIELIAQDTSNRNNIQIPSQNVVSYGKKFPISAEGSSGHHYDPFTTMSYGGSGTTLSALQSLIDTDTSLGMDAWKAGTSNYHRPWNGGRVIKWVDSSGTIKTSVNMMPPNAQNIGTTASNAVSDAHVIAGTNDDTINFNTSAIDHSQAEVVKTFHFREFGNGSANGGTLATYADASTLNATDNIAYVMDDGLTSLSGDDVEVKGGTDIGFASTTGDYIYLTFIGTGISVKNRVYSGGEQKIAQNLPYGTHIIKIQRDNNNTDYTIDGVAIEDYASSPLTYGAFNEISFYQPKRPPIPEDACVLADYMLMADFVPQTSAGLEHISKGVRACSASRDMRYNHSSGFQQANPFVPDPPSAHFGDSYWLGNSNGLVATRELVCFGNSFSVNWFQANNELPGTYKITAGQDGTTDLTNYTRASNSAGSSGAVATDGTVTRNNGTERGNYMTAVAGASVPLGVQTIKITSTHTNVGQYEYVNQIFIHTPIHTSHHYQSFETPFLHELVGGDRNMEQTNLVVSPDGKTWDEVTRNTSYLGNNIGQFTTDTEHSWANAVVFDEWRGSNIGRNFFLKYFAIAYDRMICLESGEYKFTVQTRSPTSGFRGNAWAVNGTQGHHVFTGTNTVPLNGSAILKLNRGDYVQLTGAFGVDALSYNTCFAEKLS